MIYMVDHVFSDPATEPEWHAWYAGYLQKLIKVPGIRSAQRFKALDCMPSRYLAMYTVDSTDVYASPAYRNMGGGGSQSVRFHGAYQLWTRNLFVSVLPDRNEDRDVAAPRVTTGQRVLVFDRSQFDPQSPLEARATWLTAVGLHMTTKYRAVLVLDAGESAAPVAGSYLYEPFTAFIS